MVELRLVTQTIEKTNNETELKEKVLNTLYDFGENDLDFNGENGVDYLWEEAQGYESNRDYLIERVSKYDNIETMIYEYFNGWIGKDGYYDDYECSIVYNEAKEIIAIALAYTIVH